jgi:hypothetical protein
VHVIEDDRSHPVLDLLAQLCCRSELGVTTEPPQHVRLHLILYAGIDGITCLDGQRLKFAALHYCAVIFTPYGDICLVDSVPNTVYGHAYILRQYKGFVKRYGSKGRLLTSPKARKMVRTCGSGHVVD